SRRRQRVSNFGPPNLCKLRPPPTHGGGDPPIPQPCGLQPQNLSYLAHGQPRLRHRPAPRLRQRRTVAAVSPRHTSINNPLRGGPALTGRVARHGPESVARHAPEQVAQHGPESAKGDGLVWVKRKHYFPRELNQHFFANYFRELS